MNRKTAILERQFVPQGTLVMRQGDPGNNAYLLQSGSVEVFREKGGEEISLARLEMGQIFGEMALIFDEPRSASVRTLTDCNLIVINRDTFKHKLDRSDTTIQAIVEMLIQRVMVHNNFLVNRREDVNELSLTTRLIYQGILKSLPKAYQEDFKATVEDKMDSFVKAVEEFKSRHNY